MNFQRLQTILTELQEKSFRLKQIEQAIFSRLISNWDEASNLPLTLRMQLKSRLPISALTETSRGQSTRGDTIKVTLETMDKLIIESVLIRHKTGRNTVCVSSQAGCPMRCSFCATGQQGFKRNLTADEIVDQVLHWARELNRSNERVSNVVFMGMGEPFHNYDEVLKACRQLNSNTGLNIGARHISISTCGIIPGIQRLAAEPLQLNLAISLHAPTDELRGQLMPINETYPLGKLLPAIDQYIQRTNRKVLFEYLLLDGINDNLKQADQLANLLAGKRLYHVNLIRFHRTGNFAPTPQIQRDNFFKRLKQRNISVTHRVSFGEDIQAACGMLTGKSSDKST
jgi:23S rRNA (adenine2503-C2)-methyltransferase